MSSGLLLRLTPRYRLTASTDRSAHGTQHSSFMSVIDWQVDWTRHDLNPCPEYEIGPVYLFISFFLSFFFSFHFWSINRHHYFWKTPAKQLWLIVTQHLVSRLIPEHFFFPVLYNYFGKREETRWWFCLPFTRPPPADALLWLWLWPLTKTERLSKVPTSAAAIWVCFDVLNLEYDQATWESHLETSTTPSKTKKTRRTFPGGFFPSYNPEKIALGFPLRSLSLIALSSCCSINWFSFRIVFFSFFFFFFFFSLFFVLLLLKRISRLLMPRRKRRATPFFVSCKRDESNKRRPYFYEGLDWKRRRRRRKKTRRVKCVYLCSLLGHLHPKFPCILLCILKREGEREWK